VIRRDFQHTLKFLPHLSIVEEQTRHDTTPQIPRRFHIDSRFRLDEFLDD
jgi:hypothetical protein